MRKSLFTTAMLFVLMPGLLSAHDGEDSLKPVEGNWGFTFNVNGLLSNLQLVSNKDLIGHDILFFRYYIRDNFALRAGFGINSTHTKTIKKDSLINNQINGFIEFDSLYTRSDVGLSLGIEKHLGKMRHLDPYVGAEVRLVFIGRESSKWNRVITETSGSTNIEGEHKIDGGGGIGVFTIVGFNYFITDHISLGAEYRFGYNYLKMGGNFSESEITTPSSGSATNSYKRGSLEDRKAGFEVNSSANVIFSIFF